MGMFSRQTSRRSLIKGAAVTGAGLAIAGAAGRSSSTRAQESTFTREASITSWGFGAEETNPMAFSRIDAFKQAYPSITLELVPEFDSQKLLTGFASEQVPDLVWMGRQDVASWAARGVLMPMDDLLADGRVNLDEVYPVALEDVKYDGKTYGFPQFMDVRALYVNLDALAETGTDAAGLNTGDWEQLDALGAALVKKNGDAVERWGFDHKTQSDLLWLWSKANGVDLMNADGTEVKFTDDKVVEALDWAYKWSQDQGGYQSFEAIASTWQGDEQFARGQVAMTMYENWMLGIVARVAPKLNFTVLPVRERGGDGMVTYTGGPAWCIPNGAKDPEAAYEFITFMAKTDTWMLGANAVKTAREAEGSPFIPTLTGNTVADQRQIDELYAPLGGPFDDAIALFPQMLESAFSRPIGKSPAATQINDTLKTVAVLPALRGEQSSADALETAQQDAQDAIDSL